MFSDHQNLLSTFGKDSQSSQRKPKNISLKSKKTALIFDQPRSKYQQILNQRKTQINLIKDKESIKIYQIDNNHINNSNPFMNSNNINNNKLAYKSKQRQKQHKQKLRTQTDIQYLNSRIRKSISGIAESICKSKIKSNVVNGKEKVSDFEVQYQENLGSRGSSLKKKNCDGGNICTNNRQLNQSHSQRKVIKNANNRIYALSNMNVNSNTNFNSKMRNNHQQSISHSNKQNFDINAFEISQKNSKQKYPLITSNSHNNNSYANQHLKNSTKKKLQLFQNQNNIINQTQPNQHFSPQAQQNCQSYYPIKSSFSIDLNSHSSSRFGSSQRYQKQNSKRKKQHQYQNQVERIFVNENNKNNGFYKLDNKFIMNKQMENTLKKENKGNNKYNGYDHHNYSHFDDKNYVKDISFQQTKGYKQTKFTTNQQFLFYQDLKEITLRNQQNNNNNTNRFLKNPHINHKVYTQLPQQPSPVPTEFTSPFSRQNLKPSQYHPLIQSFIKQIQLDYDLRHAKHMFSGIQQPYFHPINHQSQSKWQKLNKQLQKIGLFYPIQTIKLLFLPSQQQLDPFLSCSQPHEQLLYSLIFAYEKAQSFWQSQIYQKWQHWHLRDIDFTIQSIDRNRKGYISVEDLAAYLAVQTGIQYKNRDVVLIYKRFVSLGAGMGNYLRNNERENVSGKVKFRAVIDCLVRPFINQKGYEKIINNIINQLN